MKPLARLVRVLYACEPMRQRFLISTAGMAVVLFFFTECGSKIRNSNPAGEGGAAGDEGGEAGGAGDAPDGAGGATGSNGGATSTSAGGVDSAGGMSGTRGDGTAGAGGDAGDALAVSAQALPRASFRIPYRAELTATGGSGEDYTWTLADGALPNGLALGAEGVVQGTPAELGSFALTVEVEDSEGETAQGELTLEVGRKRWLAFRRRQGFSLESKLWLSNYVSPPGLVELQSSAPAFAGVAAFKFSPNGDKLAYSIDSEVDGINDLYVVDTSGPALGASVKVNPSGTVTNFAWSPDSTMLGFIGVLDDTTESIHFSDVSGAEPTAPTPLSGPYDDTRRRFDVTWLANDLLAWVRGNSATRQNTATFARIQGGALGSPRELPEVPGSLSRVNLETRRAVYIDPSPAPCANTYNLVDFDEEQVFDSAPGNSFYSSNLGLVAVATASTVEVYPADGVAPENIMLTLPVGSCFAAFSPTAPVLA
ncbi:MAG TPA: putative Ig domain-containing protein, partial [Polyangiaceae bacterium]